MGSSPIVATKKSVMITKDEITATFKSDLRQLLLKYDATLESDNHYHGYPGCGENVRMTVIIPNQLTKDGDVIREYAEIDLGKYFV